MKTIKFILLFLVGISYAQVKDTLIFYPEKKYTQEYVDSLIGIRLDEQKIGVYKQILESDKSLLGWPRYFSGKGNFVYNRKNYDSAMYFFDKAIDTLANSKEKRLIDERSIIQVYIFKAYYARLEKKDYKQSIVFYQKALDLTKVHEYVWKGYITTGIGDNHNQIGNDSLALKYFNITLKDTNYMSLPRPAVILHSKTADLYRKKNDFDQAIFHYNEALKISDSTTFKRHIYNINSKLARIAYQNLDLEKTEDYYKKAIEAYAEHGTTDEDELYPLFKNNSKGFISIRNRDYTSGIASLEKSITISDTISKFNDDIFYYVNFAYSEIQNAYAENGDFLNSRKYRNKHNDFLREYSKSKMEEDLQQLEVEYQTKEKDLSIAQLETSQKQQETIITQQRYLTWGLIGFLVLFSGLIFLFWRQRKFRTQVERENLEQRLLRSQMNPHFISNALNVACNLVEKKSENTVNYLHTLSRMFRLILNNSREDFIGLDEEVDTLKNYLNLESNFSQKFDYNIHVEEGIDEEEVIIPPMLIQPFVENAILHGIANTEERGKIDIQISKQDNLLVCSIQDNGLGYNEKINVDKKHKSVSGNIVKDRLEILKKKFKVNAHFTINSTENSGTQVQMYLPFILD